MRSASASGLPAKSDVSVRRRDVLAGVAADDLLEVGDALGVGLRSPGEVGRQCAAGRRAA